MMDFGALESFNRVAAAGSFAQASRSTGQPKATLSRHVRQLEQELGIRLIERGSRTFRLTDEGIALRNGTEGLLAEISWIVHDIVSGSTSLRGRLRVSAPVLFATIAMGPIIAKLCRAHPELRLEVSAEDRIVDLVRENFDAVIRINPRPDQGLIGRCFLRDHHVVVAPASLPRPDPATGSLHAVPAVMLSGLPIASVWPLLMDGTNVDIRPEPFMLVSSFLMLRDAVLAGAGAACLPISIVADDLAADRLVNWGALTTPETELWVLHTSRRLISPKVKAFVDILNTTYPMQSRRT